jgi:phage/plasmid-like protein (TIGR03299 family)
MAHLIESVFIQDQDEEAGRVAGTDSWHRIGQKIPHDKALNVAETLAACAWPTTLKVRHEVFNPVTQQREEPEAWSIIRADNGLKLGTVKERYEPWQPEETMDILAPWIETKAAIPHTGGTLDEGRILWLLLKINIPHAEVLPGDKIMPYLLYSQGTCGNLPHFLGMSVHRPVCANTLMPALRDKGGSTLVRVKHTKNQGEALKLVAENIDLATREMTATREALAAMAERGANPKDLDRYFRIVADVKDSKTKALDLTTPLEDLHGKTRNRLLTLYSALSKPGGDFGRGSIYAAYNAATWFLSHEAGTSANNRVRDLWFGETGGVAFDAAVSWCNAGEVIAA